MLENVVEDLDKRCEEANPARDGDYIGEDGLLYCATCHTRKTHRITVNGAPVIVHCNCFCQAKKYDEEMQGIRKETADIRMHEIRRECFDSPAMCYSRFSDKETDQNTKSCRSYAKSFDKMLDMGEGLLLCGDQGTGKTYNACQIANYLLDHGYSCRVITAARVLAELSGSFDKAEILDKYCAKDLLVIDDFGADRDSAYSQEQMFTLLDQRISSGKPLIITTNFFLENFKKPLTPLESRMNDRILEKCYPIQYTGSSKRMDNLRKKYNKIDEILKEEK